MSDAYYMAMADAQARNFVSEGAYGRAANVTAGFAKWRRFHADALVWVNDMEGNPKAMTPTQYRVWEFAMDPAHKMLTMRQMAEALKVAPSTVSRAFTKFMAWGLIAYIVGRGRYAGIAIIKRAKGDGYDYLRRAAKDRIRRWREAAERRFSRLIVNVALSHPQREWDSHGYGYLHDTYMSATLIAQPWTVDELEGL